MGLEFDILLSDEWHAGERKELDIRVLDADNLPVDLTGKNLSWRLARSSDAETPYIEKLTTDSGITIISADDDEYEIASIARCNIAPEDYALIPRHRRVLRHELRDDDNALVLSYGKVVLASAIGAVQLPS